MDALEEVLIKLVRCQIKDTEMWISISQDGEFKENKKALLKRVKPLLDTYDSATDQTTRQVMVTALRNEFSL